MKKRGGKKQEINDPDLQEMQQKQIESLSCMLNKFTIAFETLKKKVSTICNGKTEKEAGNVGNVESDLQNTNAVANSGQIKFDKSEKSHMLRWKELGEYQLCFSPNGILHPVTFLKHLEQLLDDADVPEEKKVSLSLDCLRGSAYDWGQVKQKCFSDFNNFKEKFRNRYWGVEQESELFHKIKFGKYSLGKMADYFLKVLKEAAFLSEPLLENKLIEYLIDHFPAEVKCGIINGGYKNVDDIEQQLRRVDDCYSEMRPRNRSGQGQGQVRAQNNDNRGNQSNWRNNENREERPLNRGTTGENEVSTVFFGSPEWLLEEGRDNFSEQKNNSPIIKVRIGNKQSEALVDTGYQASGISEEFFEELKREFGKLPTFPVNGVTLYGAFVDKGRKVTYQTMISISLGSINFEVPVLVVPDLKRCIILGYDWMLDNNIAIGKHLLIKNGEENHTFPIFNRTLENDSLLTISETGLDLDKVELNRKVRKAYTENEIRDLTDKMNIENENFRESLYKNLCKYKQVFSDEPGRISVYEHLIELKDNSPFCFKSYPVPYAFRAAVKDQISEMLNLGVIRATPTEYVSPLVTVIKKDKSVRVCLDARHLNTELVKEHFMPPNPEDILFDFSENTYLSTIDLSSSYWQI